MYTSVEQFLIAESKKTVMSKRKRINENFDEEDDFNFDDEIKNDEEGVEEVETETETPEVTMDSFTSALNAAIEAHNSELEEGEEPVAALTEKQLELAFNAFTSMEPTSVEGEEEEEVIEEGIFGFGKQKTPEEKVSDLLAKGEKALSDPKVKVIYNSIISNMKTGNYPEGAEKKFLMFYAEKGERYVSWNKELTAPDGTKGYWEPRGTVRGVGGSGKNMGA